jgi:3D (Asp-Asp-Asp) domain-containing protein
VLPPPAGTRWVPVKTTGYCPCWRCCGAFANGRTAINRDVQQFPFGIAVEPKLLPYRIELDVPGYGRALVDDTGGAMRQSAQQGTVHLDLRFETHQTALNWGVRRMWIAVPETAPAAHLPGR